MYVRRFFSFDELRPFQSQWDLAACNVPFQTWAWLKTWWEHFSGPRRELFVLAVFDNRDTFLGAAPWYVEDSRLWGKLVKILGEEEACSDHVNLLALPGKGSAVAESLSAWACQEGEQLWDTLDLNGVDADHPALCELLQRLAAAGHALHRAKCVSCWSVSLPGDWHAFVARCSRQRRKRIRRSERSILDAPNVRFHIPRDLDELKTAYATLVDLHRRRRRMQGESGCFDSPRRAAFLEEVTGRLFSEGLVLIPWLEIDSAACGAEYLLLGGGTVYAYQSGMNPDFAALGPGTLTQTAVLRWAVQSGFLRYDMLRGDEPYKSVWCHPRPRHRVRVFSRQQDGRMRYQLCSAGYAVKQTVKSGLSWIGYD